MARWKRSIKRNALVLSALAVVLCAAFSAFYLISTKQIRAVYENELNIAKAVLEENTKNVYIASRDIKCGETISGEDVSAVSAIVSFGASMFFAPADIGAVALVDIPAESVITSNMVWHGAMEDTLRETEFDVLVLNSNLANHDFVDVRIRYQNGEDYVVLAKKRVKNVSLRNAVCYMDITEEETQLISSAIVDAALYGGILYTNTYLEPGIQKASIVTYQPSKDVLGIMYNNPNILSGATKSLSAAAREEMEHRLAAYAGTHGDGEADRVFNVTGVPDIGDVGNRQGDEYGEPEEGEPGNE